MKQILDKIGGWPIVTRGWADNGYSWEAAYVYLRSRLGLNYIMSMYVDIDSKDTTRRIIYVSSFDLADRMLTEQQDARWA